MGGSSLEIYADSRDLKELFSIFKEFFEYKYVQSLSELNSLNIETREPSLLLDYLVSENSPGQQNFFLCADVATKTGLRA
jgi:hypothetical protein